MQGQPFADIVHRHLVAPVMTAAELVRVAQDRVDFAATQEDIDADHTRSTRRLDTVVDGILQQRLQHQWRNKRVTGHVLDVPLDLQTLAETHLLQIEVLPAQRDLVCERSELSVVAHQYAEQIGKVFQRSLGPARLGAHQRKHRSDAVEQEMGPDPRLQRLQTCLGDGRRQRPGTQIEIAE